MPLPESFDGSADPCAISRRWGISLNLATRLVMMADNVPFGLQIYSGARTVASQNALRAAGRPTADNDKSTHLSCPATGADVRFTLGAANLEPQSKAQFGFAARMAGLRWGGSDSPVLDALNIPVDWNHLDLGRRVS